MYIRRYHGSAWRQRPGLGRRHHSPPMRAAAAPAFVYDGLFIVISLALYIRIITYWPLIGSRDLACWKPGGFSIS